MSKRSNQVDITATIEILAEHVVAEYQQVNTVPSGSVSRKPCINDVGHACIHLNAMSSYDAGYTVANFGAFGSDRLGIPAVEGFRWYARSRLRYSCLTLVARMARFILPKLQKVLGRKEMHSTTLDRPISLLDDLEIHEVLFLSACTHAFVLERAAGMFSTTEIVEVKHLGVCQHTVLMCRSTGAVVDLSIGQFIGSMSPRIFPSIDAFVKVLPGQIVHTAFPCSPESIQMQIDRDSTLPVPFRPSRFATRVLESVRENKRYCAQCLGVASAGRFLSTCSKCKTSFYCSKHCQVLHWRGSHKSDCNQAISDSTEHGVDPNK